MLSSVVIVVALAMAFTGVGGGPGGSSATSSPSPASSAGPSATGASTAPSPVPWLATARSLESADLRLIDTREGLRAALADRPFQTGPVVRDLRTMNTTLRSALALIDSLGAAAVSSDLVAELEDVHQSALDIGVATLGASLQNEAAYRDGAAGAIAALAPLEGLLERLALASGMPEPSFRHPVASPGTTTTPAP